MDNFKLKSIEEFDSEFLAEMNQQQTEYADEKPLIPEIQKNSGNNVSDEMQDISSEKPKPASSKYVVMDDASTDTEDNGEGKPFDFSNLKAMYDDTDDEEEIKEKKQKSGKGKKGIKTISIIMVVLTVMVFICGCFVSVFIDNKGASLGRVNFSTMYETSTQYNVSKGSLIISTTPTESYSAGDTVVVRMDDGSGSDIMDIAFISNTPDGKTVFAVQSGTTGQMLAVNESNFIGTNPFFFPALGAVIHFAMENLVLVCILFILLSALWCLIIIMVEKSETTENKKK